MSSFFLWDNGHQVFDPVVLFPAGDVVGLVQQFLIPAGALRQFDFGILAGPVGTGVAGDQIGDAAALGSGYVHISHLFPDLRQPEEIAAQNRMLVDRHGAVLIPVQVAVFEHVMV